MKLAALLVLVPALAAAQGNYTTLEVISPRVTGAARTGDDADHRCKWAYPNIAYSCRVQVKGGRYPYTFALEGAPAWMSIRNVSDPETETCSLADAESSGKTWVACGEIHGTPTDTTTDDDADFDIVVTDADSDEARSDGNDVDVTTSDTRFRFLDAVSGNDTTGSGTLAAPWQTLTKIRADGGANRIVYLRAGSYNHCSIATVGDSGGAWQRVEFTDTSHPVIFIGYPNEVVTWTFCRSGTTANTGKAVRLSGAAPWIENIRSQTAQNIMWQTNSSFGVTFARMQFSDLAPDEGSANSAFIMSIRQCTSAAPPCATYGGYVWGSTFSGVVDGGFSPSGTKYYDHEDTVLEDNEADGCINANGDACFAMKGGVVDYDIRTNVFKNIPASVLAIGGNQANNDGSPPQNTSGEIHHNLSLTAPSSDFGTGCWQAKGHSDQIGPHFFYENTCYGNVTLYLLDAADSTITFSRNIIINAQAASTPYSYFIDASLGGTTNVTRTDNLFGAAGDGIINTTTGALQGAYLTAHGPDSATPKGHMLSTEGVVVPPAPGVRPRTFLRTAGLLRPYRELFQ